MRLAVEVLTHDGGRTTHIQRPTSTCLSSILWIGTPMDVCRADAEDSDSIVVLVRPTKLCREVLVRLSLDIRESNVSMGLTNSTSHLYVRFFVFVYYTAFR